MLDLPSRDVSRSAFDDDRPDADPSTVMLSSLLSISKTTRAFYGVKLAALGFHNGQDELLMAIGDHAVPVAVMADRLSVRPSTVSKMLDRLIDKGLCERTSDRRDARRTLVHITPAGREVCKTLVALRQEVEEDLSCNLDVDDRRAMVQALSDCADHLGRQLRRVR